jgi:predicted nucleic acid-binding protein
MKAMLDTNIFDKLLVDKAGLDVIIKAVKNQKLETFVTSVQINEINQIQDKIKRENLISLITEISSKKLFVELAPYGYAYGECYGGISPDIAMDDEKFITSNSHIEDAMIIATASSKKYLLEYIVTDAKTFTNKIAAQSSNIKTCNYSEFINTVENIL